MNSIKTFLVENGYGCFVDDMKLSHYNGMVKKINETFNKSYTLSSDILDEEIAEVI